MTVSRLLLTEPVDPLSRRVEDPARVAGFLLLACVQDLLQERVQRVAGVLPS